MDSNNDKKLLFNNLEEYQGEVERLEEIIKNQAQIIKELSESKTGYRKGEIMPFIMGARSYPKTFPMFGSPLYEYERGIRNNPIIFELGDTIEQRMESVMAGMKGVGKTNTNFLNSLDGISKHIENKEKPIKELLLKQSKGQFLTREEKERCIKHAELIRKKKSKK